VPRYAWQERAAHVPRARSRRASAGSRRRMRMRQQRFSRSRSSGSESGKRACRRILLLLLLLLANPSGRKSPQPLACPRPHPTQVKHDTALTKALETSRQTSRGANMAHRIPTPTLADAPTSVSETETSATRATPPIPVTACSALLTTLCSRLLLASAASCVAGAGVREEKAFGVVASSADFWRKMRFRA
jgi:hypothetical protein